MLVCNEYRATVFGQVACRLLADLIVASEEDPLPGLDTLVE